MTGLWPRICSGIACVALVVDGPCGLTAPEEQDEQDKLCVVTPKTLIEAWCCGFVIALW